MIFKSIRLQNFRQYKNDDTISFSKPDEKGNNITLLIAANGVGKTTLLQAFRYCFYGKSSNYLNLPKADELINNTLVEDLKDLDRVSMFVEVVFNHENSEYLARRETFFQKSKGVLREIDSETFKLSQLVKNEGYKPFKESEANFKIRSILPEGLSQVFMFDGERMERNISDRAFSSELKESILGILDIKKYDKLIDILGHPGKVTSVIGMLSSKKKTDNNEDFKTKKQYDSLLEKKSETQELIDVNDRKILDVKNKIQINKEQQQKLILIKDKSIEIDGINLKIENEMTILENKSIEYIKLSKTALLYKLLLLNKSQYDKFVNIGRNRDNFYSYLHTSTLQDIQDKGICVCGHVITKNSEEFDRLETLKKFALPIESAQHLNLIDQKFKQCAELPNLIEKLTIIKNDIRESKKNIADWKEDVHKISQDILKIEKQLGLVNQSEIEDLLKLQNELNIQKGKLQKEMELYEEGILKLQKRILAIDKSSQYNQKINTVIEIIQSVKSKLEAIKDEKDNVARQILSFEFNQALSKTIHGKYDVKIDSKYQIKIIDEGNNKDVTTSLSTGQNVVISLSFISALIETAKQLSSQINKKEYYGVLMDAALSNLDEVHIEKLCKNTINNMDQLIFLSFKRQLRDEMYQGIKHNIGKAYVVEKHSKGHVLINDIEVNTIDDFIHNTEEDNKYATS